MKPRIPKRALTLDYRPTSLGGHFFPESHCLQLLSPSFPMEQKLLASQSGDQPRQAQVRMRNPACMRAWFLCPLEASFDAASQLEVASHTEQRSMRCVVGHTMRLDSLSNIEALASESTTLHHLRLEEPLG